MSAANPDGPASTPPPPPNPGEPLQIFPPPGMDQRSVTSTDIRLLREEVLDELCQPDEWSDGGSSLLRPFLWVLLSTSIFFVLMLMWYRREEQIAETPLPVQNTSVKTGGSQTTPPSPAEEPPVGPPAELPHPARSDADVLAFLLREDPSLDRQRAMARLKELRATADADVKATAEILLQPLLAERDAAARNVARAAAEEAADLAEEQRYTEALRAVENGMRALPADAPWSSQGGKRLKELHADLIHKRDDDLQTTFEPLAEGVKRQDAAALVRLEGLIRHVDEQFRARAVALDATRKSEDARKDAERRARNSAGRTAWIDFYKAFDAAIVAANWDAAGKLATPPEDSPLYTGGVANPRAALTGYAAEVLAIRGLYDAAIESARSNPRRIDLPLRRGSVSGKIIGVRGSSINVEIRAGSEVAIKPEDLTFASVAALLHVRDRSDRKLEPALWALQSHERPAEAAVLLPKAYAAMKMDLPAHWSERFAVERLAAMERDLDRLVEQLQSAIDRNNPDVARSAVDAAQPTVKTLTDAGAISAESRAVFTAAEKLAGQTARRTVILQNGVSPTVEYSGITTDQISDYRDSRLKTDVGVQFGLKVGASGGLQRVLIRFDGLETAIGNGRVVKARLELFQTESPQSLGATIGLFRLRRPWVPDQGSWTYYDTEKKQEWATAGANGANDVEVKEDAKLVLDKAQNAWRSWDVTTYVQGILMGKVSNEGLLMRVINGEPDFHVRFYPETDVVSSRDATRRPRLVLDIERTIEVPVPAVNFTNPKK